MPSLMARFSAPFRLAALGLALGACALAAPEAAAQEARREAAPADTVRPAPGLFDTRVAAGHKPRRRGARRPVARAAPDALPPPPPRSTGTYEAAPLTPGGGSAVSSVPPPRGSQTAAPEASGAYEAPPLYDAVPERPAFFDSRIAWGHKDPASRSSDPLFDTRVAEGHKELPALSEFEGLFLVPAEAAAYVDAQQGIVARRFGGTARLQRRYFPAIERALAARELPHQLKYVALIESGLDPQAVSHAGARGLWQIMPATAGDFGLDSMAVHEPAAATRAAVLYLDRLHRMFDGDWLLALAAYNGGPGRVFAAVRAFERNMGRTPTFWEVRHRLPRETREYVPRFIAAVRHFEAEA